MNQVKKEKTREKIKDTGPASRFGDKILMPPAGIQRALFLEDTKMGRLKLLRNKFLGRNEPKWPEKPFRAKNHITHSARGGGGVRKAGDE